MATKSVYQPFIPEAITHFGIDCDPYGIMVSNISGEIETVYVDESSYTYNKILKILQGGNNTTTPNLSFYKKAFIMPGCPVSQDRAKSALKEHGISLTNDYEKADVYIFHDYLDDNSYSNAEKLKTTRLLYHLENYSACDEGCSTIDQYCEDNKRNGETARVIWTDKVSESINTYSVDDLEFPYDGYMMTGMAINLAYNIETGIAGAVDIDEILCQSANKIVITESLLEDLTKYCSSYTDEDNSIGAKILPTIDYNKELHLIWKLAQDIGSNLYRFNRDKDVQYWIDNSCIDDFNNFCALDMIKYLEKQKKLNRKAFKYLESIVRKEIRIENRDLYVFKVEVKPEYRKYLKNKENDEKNV